MRRRCSAIFHSLLLLRSLTRTTGREYGQQFADPLLRAFFAGGEMSGISAMAIVFSIAWMGADEAEICCRRGPGHRPPHRGESRTPGRRVRFKSKVERILVENGAAIGVRAGRRRDDQGGLGDLCRGRPLHDLRTARRHLCRRARSTRLTRRWNFSPLRAGLAGCRARSARRAGQHSHVFFNASLQIDPGTCGQSGFVPDLQLRSHLCSRRQDSGHVLSARRVTLRTGRSCA